MDAIFDQIDDSLIEEPVDDFEYISIFNSAVVAIVGVEIDKIFHLRISGPHKL